MRSTFIRDKNGYTLGRIDEQQGQTVLYNRSGQRLGHYYHAMDSTFDVSGRRVSGGNTLMMLL